MPTLERVPNSPPTATGPRAQASGAALAVAILCTNQARASAKMGFDDEALAPLGRSRDEFTRADNGYGQDMTRSRSFDLISLATDHPLEDDIDHTATAGAQVVAVAESLKTAWTKDRLRPLKREADKRRNNADARALSERIATYTSAEAVWRPRIPPVPAA